MTENSGPRVVTLGELQAIQFPPREPLISPWFRKGDSAMIYAPTGLGKSMFTMTLALLVAGGGRVMGWTNETPRRVMILDGEMSAEDLKERGAMLAKTVDGINGDAAAANLLIFAGAMQHDSASMPDLNDPQGHETILRLVKEKNVELLIIDNFSVLSQVEDENSASAMGPMLELLMKLKWAKVACILVHHSGKAGSSYRGSSKLAVTFEVILGLKKINGSSPLDGASFTISLDKFRGKADAAIANRVFRLDSQSDGPRWIIDGDAGSSEQQFCDLVRSGRYRLQDDIAKALEVSKGQCSKTKKRAIAAGLITADEIDSFLKPKERSKAAS